MTTNADSQRTTPGGVPVLLLCPFCESDARPIGALDTSGCNTRNCLGNLGVIVRIERWNRRATPARSSLPPDFGKLMRRLNEAGAGGNCNCADLAQDGRTCEFHKSYIALEAAIAALGKCSVCRGTGKCVAGPGVCICGDGSAAGELRYLHDTGARQAIALHGAALGQEKCDCGRERAKSCVGCITEECQAACGCPKCVLTPAQIDARRGTPVQGGEK